MSTTGQVEESVIFSAKKINENGLEPDQTTVQFELCDDGRAVLIVRDDISDDVVTEIEISKRGVGKIEKALTE
jgi:hypothetical protein